MPSYVINIYSKRQSTSRIDTMLKNNINEIENIPAYSIKIEQVFYLLFCLWFLYLLCFVLILYINGKIISIKWIPVSECIVHICLLGVLEFNRLCLNPTKIMFDMMSIRCILLYTIRKTTRLKVTLIHYCVQ